MSPELERQFYCFFQKYEDGLNEGGILLSTFMASQNTYFRGFDYQDVVNGLKELQERGYVIGNGQTPIEMIFLTAKGRERFYNK